MVETAIIPAAGLGTRMAPYSWYYPKEMIPIGTTPALFYICRELFEAEVVHVIVVLSQKKQEIERILTNEFPEISYNFIYQEEQNGLADALLLGYKHVANSPVHMILPDNICIDQSVNITRLLSQAFDEVGQSVLGMIEVKSTQQAKMYGASGIGEFQEIGNELYRISGLKDKRSATADKLAKPPFFRTIGRGVLTQEFFEAAEALRPEIPAGKEFDDVPIYQQLIADFALFGYLLSVLVYDIGNEYGYLKAQKAYLNQRNEKN